MAVNKNLLDVLFPEHTKNSCSDENPCNGMAINSPEWVYEHPCLRCSALKYIKDNASCSGTVTHEDHDGDVAPAVSGCSIPEDVNSICVTHDGGRLAVALNNEEVFRASFGTRDCSIEIVRGVGDDALEEN